MKAQVIYSYGDPSVFCLEEMPLPKLQAGHVLIRVKASAVNPIDIKIRSGKVPIVTKFPAILHGDVAGVVEAIAEDVKNIKKGDEVFAFAGGTPGMGGSLAEFMLVDARLVAQKPRTLTMEAAAALPIVSLTAWFALFEKAQLKADEKILIQAGAGGVGHIAVQLAKICGAKVYATIRKLEDLNYLKTLNVDEIINIKEEKLKDYRLRLTQDQGFDKIFDTLGDANLELSFEAAALNASIVTTAARVNLDLSPMHNKGLSLHCFFLLLYLKDENRRALCGDVLQKIAKLVDEGKLKPRMDPHHFTLNEVSQAHELLESGKARGKVVISL